MPRPSLAGACTRACGRGACVLQVATPVPGSWGPSRLLRPGLSETFGSAAMFAAVPEGRRASARHYPRRRPIMEQGLPAPCRCSTGIALPGSSGRPSLNWRGATRPYPASGLGPGAVSVAGLASRDSVVLAVVWALDVAGRLILQKRRDDVSPIRSEKARKRPMSCGPSVSTKLSGAASSRRKH